MGLSSFRIHAPTLFGSALLLSLPQEGTPTFAPSAGASVDKHFVTNQYLELKVKETLVDGALQPDNGRMTLSGKQELNVTDVYRSSEGGRPIELRRLFKTASSDVLLRVGAEEGASEELKIKGTGALDGVGVVFTWVEEEADYGKHFDALEAEESLLIGLEEDLDLRGLLPANDVEIGGEWKVDAGVLASVFAHGGDAAIAHTGEVPDSVLRSTVLGVGANAWRHFGGETEGDVTLRYAGPRDQEGARVAVITFEFDVSTSVDQTKAFSDGLSYQEYRAGLRVERASSTLELKGSGELVWNLALGRMAGLECKADQKVSLSWAGRVEGEKAEVTLSENLAFAGTIEVAASAKTSP